MTTVEFAEDGVRIDAAVLAKAFGISADDLKQALRDGTITSRFERGEGKDAGKARLVFFSSNRRVRLTVDNCGNVLTRSAVDLARPGVRTGPPPILLASPHDRLR